MNPQLKTLEQLQHTFDSGLTRPLSWRQQQLKQLSRFLEDHEKDLLEALQQGFRKVPQRVSTHGNSVFKNRHKA